MRGTVAKKNKRWYAVIYDGIDEETGRQKRRWIPGGTRDTRKADAGAEPAYHPGTDTWMGRMGGRR